MRVLKSAPTSVAGLLCAMKPVSGFVLPHHIGDAMRLLCRPVVPITKEQYDAVLERGIRDQCDVYTFRGGWVTYGTADGGYALWQLVVKPILA